MFSSQPKRRVPGAAVLCGVAASLLVSSTTSAQENAGFPFVIPWDDGAPTLIDLSSLNAVPAGQNGQIVARGEHLYEANTGRRVRLFGVAWTFDANFPEHADADKVTKRLAKYGVNAVRVHYIDAGSYSRRTIWDASKGDFRHIDPAQRDRLDYLLAQFKKHGIYVDINLMVARRFAPVDGFPDAVKQLPGRFSKRVDHFDSHMIELQKEYARDLLTHLNPYTGMTLATDPGVYAVEINNENTLLGFDSGAGLSTLPQPFRAELQERWNAWLAARYGGNAALRRAWNGAAAGPGPGDRDRTVETKGLSVLSGADQSLVKPGESLEAGSVSLPAKSVGAQRADWFNFLYEIEAGYAHEMRAFLKNDLGVSALVICSQMNYGTYGAVYRESESDYSDYHAYWDDPVQPGGTYDRVANTIKNQPMTPDLKMGTFQKAMQYRVMGRPFSISEYNHPAPNEYTVETLPLLASLGSRQDMDALVLHEYGPYGSLGDGDTTKYQSYFAVGANPSKWAFLPAMALAFRTQMIAPASQVATAEMPAQFSVAPSGVTTSVAGAWKGKWPDDATYNWQTRLILGSPQAVQLPPSSPETQVSLRDPNSEKAVFVTVAPAVSVITGYVAERKITAGEASFEFGAAPDHFAALTCASWDGKPLAQSGRVILTCAARVHNTDQTWRADRKALTSWGHGPVLVEGVAVKVELPASGPRRVWALDETGAPEKEIPSIWAGGKIRFAISPEDKTVWWAVIPWTVTPR